MPPNVFVSKVLRRTLLPVVSRRRRLGFITWLSNDLENGEPELRQLAKIVPRGCRTAVDAGANLGCYSFRLSTLSLCTTVHAFECNANLTEDLRAANLRGVFVHNVGLSDGARQLTLYIPITDQNMSLHGWGSFDRGNCPGIRRYHELSVPVRPLDDYELKDVDFFKIDVEGHELHVVDGAANTLSCSRGRILIETVGSNRDALSRKFAAFGFHPVAEGALGLRGSSPQNLIFERG